MYLGSEAHAKKLSRRYTSIVPKDVQGKKKVGRPATGDKEKGVKVVWPH
jgi:hypothetical protein